jgi:hypothetical protein
MSCELRVYRDLWVAGRVLGTGACHRAILLLYPSANTLLQYYIVIVSIMFCRGLVCRRGSIGVGVWVFARLGLHR